MEILDLITYAAMFVASISAIAVIFSRNAVRAVLFLILSFVATAAVWLILEAEFLAISLVLVYVGAVMVLFLFVVMMLDIEKSIEQQRLVKHLPLAALFGMGMFALLAFSLWETFAYYGADPIESNNNIKVLGEVLFTQYIYPFELAGVILLVAIVAAIHLTFRGKKNSKKQHPHLQVQVTKTDSVKIVKMPSEKE